MELDERPSEEYSDIGGLDKQIEEVHTLHRFRAYNYTYMYMYLSRQGLSMLLPISGIIMRA